jgi:GNAT superfamily N-acetyltransferase
MRKVADTLVRPIDRSDYPQWLPLWAGYNAFYGREGPTALDPAITATTWDRFFDAGEPVYAVVAEADGMLVGLAHYLFHRSTTAIGPVCYLQDLFTSPAARGQGMGRVLIEGVSAAAQDAGCSRVYWQTHETKLTAMRLLVQIAC